MPKHSEHLYPEHLPPEYLPPEYIADPLRRFPVFRTSDPDEFTNALLTRFGARRVEVKSPARFRAQGNLVQLQSVGLVYGVSNSGVSVDYPEADRFRLLTAVTGKGEATIAGKTIEINAHQSCIVSQGQCARLTADTGHSWFNLRIDPGAFEQKLAYLLGARPNAKLEFAPAVNRDHPQV